MILSFSQINSQQWASGALLAMLLPSKVLFCVGLANSGWHSRLRGSCIQCLASDSLLPP